MATIFYYAARANDGTGIKGSMLADSHEQAVRHLRARALFVTSLERATSARGMLAWLESGFSLGRGAQVLFFRSFATMIGAGVPMRHSLETLTLQSRDARFSEALRSVAAEVESGSALSGAMERHPGCFSRVAIAIVRAGETGGSLDGALASVADLEERDRALRKRVGAAMAYPIVISVAAFGLLMFLLANTMPAFAKVFAQMHVTLPPTTRFLIGLGQALDRPLVWIGIALAAGAMVWSKGHLERSSSPLASFAQHARLSTPVFGAIRKKTTVARFSRTLGTLLAAGVDIVAAIDSARDVVSGSIYRDGLSGLIEALRRGDTLLEPLEATGLFEGTFLQLVKVGEESGTLDVMLLRLAAFYELDVETSLTALTSILEPILICLLGGAIGTIVASILIPLYSMIGGIQ